VNTTCATALDVQYRQALLDYLAHPDEARLERAYGVGRQALADGLGHTVTVERDTVRLSLRSG